MTYSTGQCTGITVSGERCGNGGGCTDNHKTRVTDSSKNVSQVKGAVDLLVAEPAEKEVLTLNDLPNDVRENIEEYLEEEGVGSYSPIEYQDVYAGQREDGGYTVTWLSHDEDPMDYEWSEGVAFEQFRTEWDRDEYYNEQVEEHGKDRVFIVDKYDHGNVHYSIADTKPYPDRRWDVAPSGVFVAPEDADDPEKYAESALEEYSDWSNGDVYFVNSRNFDRQGNPEEEMDSCGGFIGVDYANVVAKEAAQAGGI